jgi:hypothetical protein
MLSSVWSPDFILQDQAAATKRVVSRQEMQEMEEMQWKGEESG